MQKSGVPVYNRDGFPFAGIFEDLTVVANQLQLTALQAYVWYQEERRRRGLKPGPDYCSTALTTGGHSRQATLESLEVIARNTASAQMLLGELVTNRTINPRSAILPADLGYVKHWGQSDYLNLWLCVVGGLSITNSTIARFERTLQARIRQQGINFERFNDAQTAPQERAPEYFRFAEAFVQACSRIETEAHPAHRLINLIDTRDSLGAQTERVFARRMGIPVYDIMIAGDPATSDGLYRNPQLREDLATIVRYGGTTIQFLPGSTFVLRERPRAFAEK